MVAIYPCMCGGSLPVVEDESVLIRANFNSSLRPSVMTRRWENQAKQGSITAEGPQRKAVGLKFRSKRKQLVNCANFYDE